MKISYSILTHNETTTLEKLLKFLVKYKQPQDEIVILDDYSDNEKTKAILDFYVSTENIVFEQRNLLGDFASQKNYLKNMCSGDYSFNLDSDEMISHWFMADIHELLEGNPVDLIFVPRVNTVKGITEEHCRMYGYKINERGWINYPDYQARVYRNTDAIHWTRKVHEYIVGTKEYSHLPPHEELSLYHHKSIDKQEQQNRLYSDILENSR